jgi:hypothetical protein
VEIVSAYSPAAFANRCQPRAMIQCMRKSVVALLMATAAAHAADLPTGQIVDSVECALDNTQHYALYLPSNYTPSRQ